MTKRSIVEIRVNRIKLDRNGYDKYGAYFGIGAPVYMMTSPYSDLVPSHSFRASGFQNARVYARSYVDFHHKADVVFTR